MTYTEKITKLIIEEFGPFAYTAGGVTIFSKILPRVERAFVLQAVGTVPAAAPLVGVVTGYSPSIGGVVQPNAFVVKLYRVGTLETAGNLFTEYSGTVSSMTVLLGVKG
ncbi:MAG: hypothetical protein QW290_10055 [Sulfolobales archaeon]